MNLTESYQQFPAGLVDDGTEYFTHENERRCLSSGRVTEVYEFSPRFKALIDEVIESNPRIRSRLNVMGYFTVEDMRNQYYRCNYSAYDHNPDITASGILGPREYVSCADRGVCSGECVVCQIPFGLTKRQRDVLRLIGLGMLDKEICDELGISLDTLRNHKDEIRIKTGEERKTAQGVLAHKVGII